VRLATLWQLRDGPVEGVGEVRLKAEVIDAGDRVRQTVARPLTDGRYPVAQWRAGEPVLDQARWPVDLPPGRYQLRLTLTVGEQAYPVDAGRPLAAVEVRE
jgi:hypothetical protein